MSYGLKAKNIFDKLIEAGIIDSVGEIKMKLLNTEFNLQEKSALGNIIEEWLKHWLTDNDTDYRVNPNSQEPPDLFLSDDDTSGLLEVKTFDYTKSANFDVANFDTYIRALIKNPAKIDADYLIFGYKVENGGISIKKVWLKKVWEICCPSGTYPIKTQNKQNKIYNIRPASWDSTRSTYQTFTNRSEFILALNETIQMYDLLSSEINKDTWLDQVSNKYKEITGTNILG